MSVFFSGFMGEWIVARNKQIAQEQLRGSRDLFVPRYDSFPHEPRKKDTHSLNNIYYSRHMCCRLTAMVLTGTCHNRILFEHFACRRKRMKSDSVLWKKTLIPTENSKTNRQHKNVTKTSITLCHNDCGRT